MEKRYNARHRSVEYNVGDYVLLRRETKEGLNNTIALSTNYIGPYRVIKKIGRVSYRIERLDDEGYRTQVTAHIKRLRPYISRDTTASMGGESDVTPIRSEQMVLPIQPMNSRDRQLSNDIDCSRIGPMEQSE
ncbi:hypothetical protein BB560_006525 [Smittium megazygosporum]|uniref:Tf2-1-like SH3-like domain-containing protein n=1 Tax=Smittium megazygosporum TaxID=133381 RepID=A0A2T9Y4Q2_9FUNG|nr:hypothetical protein BB560_006525 [Smittium megazygosporum]